ncbi:flagellar motor protein MotB [Brucepastera parasyntrophica]|uniref:flagellar motor protein MotB n=1 Tax=Brucepastera parasyntrophica TaxID=2880008 RepID=UPI00210F02E8|nr:flagellar motor protein MotB [Brucepastera parasyntrophica]ULQ59797.1 flagellar motor protein MotB [Brucepastera parasyntrophica]
MAKKKREAKAAGTGWLNTYADMITLCLCFFVMLYDPSEVDVTQLSNMTASIHGDPTAGGQSMTSGKLADLGNSINSMPSQEKGRSLGLAVRRAVSVFAPDIKSNKITLTSDERGLVITLASDAFFRTASAELDIEETRDTMLRLAQFLSSDDLEGRRFRIEGHTDSGPTDPAQWPSNWELSTARAVNVLHYLTDFGADESQFSVAGYADKRPRPGFSNDTPEGRAKNRRVDIIIVDEGHF